MVLEDEVLDIVNVVVLRELELEFDELEVREGEEEGEGEGEGEEEGLLVILSCFFG